MEENRLTPIVFDRYARQWREADRKEKNCLTASPESRPGSRRSGKWSLKQKSAGLIRRHINRHQLGDEIEGVFFPEIIDAARIDACLNDEQTMGMKKVALFHDAFPVIRPDLCPAKTVAHFPRYLDCLAKMDHVICVSASSEKDLLQYWENSGLKHPETSVVPLGLPMKKFGHKRTIEQSGKPLLNVLCIGTLEARKNHLSLLQACESLWAEGCQFELTLAGMLNKETGDSAAKEIQRLKSLGRNISWEGAVSDNRLQALYQEADIFVYPSIYEGFGIPVLEAASYGLPILTTHHGALKEVASEGGCVICDGSSSMLSSELRNLLGDKALRESLSRQANEREIRSMKDVTKDIQDFLAGFRLQPNS
jgi:glycosyltransferase involved in cell wall biosynthesis